MEPKKRVEGGKVDNATGWRHIYLYNKIGYKNKIGSLLFR